MLFSPTGCATRWPCSILSCVKPLPAAPLLRASPCSTTPALPTSAAWKLASAAGYGSRRARLGPRPGPRGLRAWASFAYNDFRFGSAYVGAGGDASGNRLPGTAPQTLSAGLDFSERTGFYLSPNLGHQARIQLNDANSAAAVGYWVYGARGGWRRTLAGHLDVNLFAGLDNAFDRRYSLGNDLNAFGNRFFQPAPGRSYYGGAQVGWAW
nr:TonB-dependent receptor [Hymenobacter coccineus]